MGRLKQTVAIMPSMGLINVCCNCALHHKWGYCNPPMQAATTWLHTASSPEVSIALAVAAALLPTRFVLSRCARRRP